MRWIQNIFSVYIDVVMLCIGLYMAFVQGKNLLQVNHMHREAQFSKIVGWIYIIVAIIGFILVNLY